MDKLLLIDGNSIMNRAFYGTQSGMLQNAEGFFTGAVFGFMNIFLKVLDEEKPTHAAIAFDLKAPTFRHKMYDGYKATRKGMPPGACGPDAGYQGNPFCNELPVP